MSNYYEAPDQEIFEDIQKCAVEVWKSQDFHKDYVEEKVGKINSLANVKDNYMYIVGMFDQDNQAKLLNLVQAETYNRLIEAAPQLMYLVD